VILSQRDISFLRGAIRLLFKNNGHYIISENITRKNMAFTALIFPQDRKVRVENPGYSVPFSNNDRFCHIFSKKAQYLP